MTDEYVYKRQNDMPLLIAGCKIALHVCLIADSNIAIQPGEIYLNAYSKTKRSRHLKLNEV